MSWVSPKVRGGKSSINGGRGVFADEDIKKGEILTIYGGYVINLKEFQSLSDELKEFPYHISEKLLFGPTKKKDVGISEYFNHSCQPNAGFRDSITLVAMRDVNKNEEITFDYATCMTSDILNFKCSCGKNNCRNIITGNDWRKTELQNKYKGYFIPYIQDKIDKIKNK